MTSQIRNTSVHSRGFSQPPSPRQLHRPSVDCDIGLTLSVAITLALFGLAFVGLTSTGCSGTDASAATSAKARAAANTRPVPATETYPIAPEVVPKEPVAPASADRVIDAEQAAAPSIAPAPQAGPDSRSWRDRPPARKALASTRGQARSGAGRAAPASGRAASAQEAPAAAAPAPAFRPSESPAPIRAQPVELKKRLPLVDDQPRINIVD
jgi:hypothetical protein